jgi:uncharacterized protein YacL
MALRMFFMGVGILVGIGLGRVVFPGNSLAPVIGGSLAAVFAGIILVLASRLQRFSATNLKGGGLGFAIGVSLASGVVFVGGKVFSQEIAFIQIITALLFLGLPYLGLVIGSRIGQENLREVQGSPASRLTTDATPKLLDTSVIIDGRIADLCETGFVEGSLIIPQFILQELQHISDSSDGLKRARGRRGLDILNHIQKTVEVDVQIVETDFPHIKEVDAKLVELGKKMDAKILTNDFNLNKVAELQGVQVLNINDLCNALKPVVLPGETIRVFVLKEGKEAGQGVAYLDDGTMVVVDNAKRCIGKNVDVVVTSVLQTSAGRMIFTRLKEEPDRDVLSFARG